jgi:hypothetical protein
MQNSYEVIMSGPIIPGFRAGYRTTTAMFKWILLIAAIGSMLLVYVFWRAVRDVDKIYKDAGYPESSRFFKDPKKGANK